MIDWRKILMAYISHVGACEGIDFLPAELDGLTAEENAALNEAAADLLECRSYRVRDIRSAE